MLHALISAIGKHRVTFYLNMAEACSSHVSKHLKSLIEFLVTHVICEFAWNTVAFSASSVIIRTRFSNQALIMQSRMTAKKDQIKFNLPFLHPAILSFILSINDLYEPATCSSTEVQRRG